MKEWTKTFILVTSSVFTLSACIPQQVKKIDPMAFYLDADSKMQIPAICKSAYEAVGITRVGVVDFTNKSFAKVTREVEKKLPETVADAVIDEIVNMGGAKVFSRTEMQKILQEHQFQMSGLVDDSTLIKFGKLAGLEYIITGSINDIGFSRTGFVGASGAAVTTDIAIRMLDITTGEIVLSKIVKGREILHSADYIGTTSAIKKAAGKALEDIRPEFSKRFTIKGYVLQTRTRSDGKERSGLINIGERNGLKAGYKMIIYTFQEIKDPFTGKATCDKVKLPVEAEVTDQIQEDKAWILIEGDINQIKRVQTGALVERAPMEGQMWFKKIGF